MAFNDKKDQMNDFWKEVESNGSNKSGNSQTIEQPQSAQMKD